MCEVIWYYITRWQAQDGTIRHAIVFSLPIDIDMYFKKLKLLFSIPL